MNDSHKHVVVGEGGSFLQREISQFPNKKHPCVCFTAVITDAEPHAILRMQINENCSFIKKNGFRLNSSSRLNALPPNAQLWTVNSCVICDRPCDPGAIGRTIYLPIGDQVCPPRRRRLTCRAVVCLRVQMFVLIDL